MNKCISVSISNRPIEELYGHVYLPTRGRVVLGDRQGDNHS